MNRQSVSFGVVILTVLLAAPAAAQKKPPAPAVDLVSVGDTLATPVVLATSQPKQRVSGTVVPPPKPAGKLRDFVIDTRSGVIQFAAVAAGGKLRSVPIAKIEWVAGAKHWRLALTEKALGALPILPYRDLLAAGAQTTRHCYATALARAAVTVRHQKKLGQAIDVIVERRTRLIAFVKVRTATDVLPIPIGAIDIATGRAIDDPPAMRVGMTLAQLESAPKPGAKKTATLTNLAFREKLYKFFAVLRPVYELKPVGKKEKPVGKKEKRQ